VTKLLFWFQKYIDQSDNSSWHVIGFDAKRFSRLITYWSVENVISDATPYRMLLDVKKIQQASNFN
jgi:hypothetical protein